jgi:hypothetical protein
MNDALYEVSHRVRIGRVGRLNEVVVLLPLRRGVQAAENGDEAGNCRPIAVSEDQIAGHDQQAATDQQDEHDHRNPVLRNQLPTFLLWGVARRSGHLVVIGGRVAGCGTVTGARALCCDAAAT